MLVTRCALPRWGQTRGTPGGCAAGAEMRRPRSHLEAATMCGIFGYLFAASVPGQDFTTDKVLSTVLGGLKKLEYRGYDSAGVSITPPELRGAPLVVKSTGKISALRSRAADQLVVAGCSGGATAPSHVGIGHTRWATHGPPSDINSHPHTSGPAAEFVVVHNGIISNNAQLKTFLASKGATFVSDTDTEVVPHLLAYLHAQALAAGKPLSLPKLVLTAMVHLEGAFALLVQAPAAHPGQLVAAKRGSPLVYAVSGGAHPTPLEEEAPVDATLTKAGASTPEPVQVWLASDAAALLSHSRHITVLQDEDLLHLGADGAVATYNLGRVMTKASSLPQALSELAAQGPNVAGLSVERKARRLSMPLESVMKGGYDHYMQKEIHEQPKSLADTITGRVLLGKPLLPASSSDLGSQPSSAAVSRRASFTSPRASTSSSRRGSSPDDSLLPGRGAAMGAGMVSAFAAFSTEALSERSDSPTMGDRRGWEEAQAVPLGPTIRLGGLMDHLEAIRGCRRLLFIACGTSFHACLAARATLEEFAAMPVVLELAGDFMDREAPIFRDDTCVFVSQSGETADTLRALEYAKAKGALCIGITNTVGSAISRQTDAGVHLNAGFEIGVASTKAYTSQVVALTMVALLLGADSRAKSTKRDAVITALAALPEVIAEALQLDADIKRLAGELQDINSLLFFGRGYNYATALEAALKVKEVALIHSEGINAGEMKHGPLALVDEHLPIVVLATKDNMHRKMDSVIQQLLARNAKLYIVCNKGDAVMAKYAAAGCRLIEVPHTVDALQPVVNVVPLQLLSYHLTVLRGFDVDQPRNLAKSVTVTEE